MQRRAQAIATVLALLVAIPVSAATWGGRGFYEPDTAFDEREGFMHLVPDTSGDQSVRQVYFSTHSGQYVETSNANSGVLGSQVMSYPTNIHAFLGVWKDCNADGYIGSLETALLEYRSEILLRQDICPAQRGLDVHAPGYTPTHNDGEWVREFLWIGPDYVRATATEDGCYWSPTTRECTRVENATNPYNIADEGARIWADWGLPDEAPKASCPVNPRPRGTYQSTGGALRFVDCLTNWRITGAVNDVAAETGLSALSFADAPYNRPDQSGSLLNQKNPYGQESDASYVSAWDCSAEPTYVDDPTDGAGNAKVTDPTSGDDIYFNVSNPKGNIQPGYAAERGVGAPGLIIVSGLYTDDSEDHWSDFLGQVNTLKVPSVNTGGSLAGTTNETLEGGAGDCDRKQGIGEASNVYALDEDDFEASPLQRVRTDIMFFFTEGIRADPKPATPDDQLDEILGDGTPPQGGHGLAWPLTGSPSWFGSPGYVASRNPYVNRDNLQPWGAVYVSAYAKVTRSDVKLATTGFGTYGAQHCAGAVPITGAFECDTLKWYPSPQPKAGYPNARGQWHAVVGDTYNLKDTDCYDASPTKYVEGVSMSIIGENVCQRPATPSLVADATDLVS